MIGLGLKDLDHFLFSLKTLYIELMAGFEINDILSTTILFVRGHPSFLKMKISLTKDKKNQFLKIILVIF